MIQSPGSGSPGPSGSASFTAGGRGHCSLISSGGSWGGDRSSRCRGGHAGSHGSHQPNGIAVEWVIPRTRTTMGLGARVLLAQRRTLAAPGGAATRVNQLQGDVGRQWGRPVPGRPGRALDVLDIGPENRDCWALRRPHTSGPSGSAPGAGGVGERCETGWTSSGGTLGGDRDDRCRGGQAGFRVSWGGNRSNRCQGGHPGSWSSWILVWIVGVVVGSHQPISTAVAWVTPRTRTRMGLGTQVQLACLRANVGRR